MTEELEAGSQLSVVEGSSSLSSQRPNLDRSQCISATLYVVMVSCLNGHRKELFVAVPLNVQLNAQIYVVS